MRRTASALLASSIFLSPLIASALSLTIQSLSPASTVVAKTDVTFKIVADQPGPFTYQLTDSFGATSASVSNISGGGTFSWNPWVSDVGTHTFTITATSYADGAVTPATVSQTIVVLPPPSISIQSVLPGNKVAPGTTVSFNVVQSGFTNPTYSISDSFSGSSVANLAMGPSGYFSWTPGFADTGKHTITVYATDSLGHNHSASVDFTVGAGASLFIGSITPGATIKLGQNITFNVVPVDFSPTSYSVKDDFPGSSITNANINTNGQFSWMPMGTEAGTHTLTIRGQVGVFGEVATTTQKIIVNLADGTAVQTPIAATTPVSGGNTSLTDLQSKLAELNAKILAQTAGTPAPTVTAGVVFTLYLKPGSEGDEVTRLQNLLSKLGFLTASPNGYFGPATQAAVIKFQAAHNLEQLGVVGPATRAALNALGSSSGSAASTASTAANDGYKFEHFMGFGWDVGDGNDALELQKRLISIGFLSGEATGYFGNMTVAAVKKFQIAHSLPATGYVGYLTRDALNK